MGFDPATLDCTVVPGTHLGPYEIIAPLGKGGMGEVYRARYTRLERDVAVKVLPAELAADPERLARLQREARMLAQLEHPNVAAIHGLEEATPAGTDGPIRFLVMQLAEGETLSERIAGGPIPVEEGLAIALQIAEGLEAAHDKGIVHRDLKPANVKVVEDAGGSPRVKILDFGLAKAYGSEGPAAEISPDKSASPTVLGATRAGVILGTAAYMSPEQARGKLLDRRTDIWAFGVVVLEMLTGERAFEGETVSETLASVIKDEPDLDRLPPETPVRVRDLLQRCLDKDPRRRLQAIGEARVALDDALAEPGAATLATARERAEAASGQTAETVPGWRRVLPWAVAGVLVVVLAGLIFQPRLDEGRSLTFQIEAGTEEDPFVAYGPSMVLSPDGERLALVTGQQPNTRLHVRALEQLEPTALPRTEGAMNPFFSPDGRWIGFFSGGFLKKIAVTGGAPITLCEASDGRGGSWGGDGTIVFAAGARTGLARVRASGGEPETITTPDPEREGESHRWPQILPGGNAVLFIGGTSGDSADAHIMAVTLETGEVRTIHRGAMYARCLPTGHLVYVHQGTLFAVGFDPDRLQMVGSPVPVLESVTAAPENAGAQYSVSDNGTLIYIAGPPPLDLESTLHWAARDGEVSPAIERPGPYWFPALSPAGSRLAVSIGLPPGEADIWVRDLERGTMTRLTFDAAGAWLPVWSPDGRWIAYAAESSRHRLRVKRADGVGEATDLSQEGSRLIPMDWSPDGRTLLVRRGGFAGPFDLHLLHLPEGILEGESSEPVESEPFLASEFELTAARFSPDGHWVAYGSDESGRDEAYVRPYRERGGKWQVSTDGGQFPVWSTDATELFYLDEDRIMAVPYTASAETFSAGQPQSIVELPFLPSAWFNLKAAPDGDRFLVPRRVSEGAADAQPGDEFQAIVVLNWFEELERQVPTER